MPSYSQRSHYDEDKDASSDDEGYVPYVPIKQRKKMEVSD